MSAIFATLVSHRVAPWRCIFSRNTLKMLPSSTARTVILLLLERVTLVGYNGLQAASLIVSSQNFMSIYFVCRCAFAEAALVYWNWEKVPLLWCCVPWEIRSHTAPEDTQEWETFQVRNVWLLLQTGLSQFEYNPDLVFSLFVFFCFFNFD